MDRDDILKVLQRIGASNVRSHDRNVECSCLLSRWRKGHTSNAQGYKASMGISIAPGGSSLVHCFACGYGGTLFQAVSLWATSSEAPDSKEILRWVANLEQGDPDATLAILDRLGDEPKSRGAPPLSESLMEEFEPMGSKYLLNRGLELGTQEFWGVCWDAERQRVVFPVRDFRGVLVGAVGRAVTDQKLKYWNYWNFPKGKVLFGAQHATTTRAIVVEGIIDTVLLWQAVQVSDWSVVGLMGAEVTKAQVDLLVDRFEEVVIFLDNDSAGFSGTLKLHRELNGRIHTRMVHYTSELQGIVKDPADAVRARVTGALLHAAQVI